MIYIYKEKLKNAINILLFIVTIGLLVYFCVHENNLLTLINIAPDLNYFWIIAALLSVGMCWVFDSITINEIVSDTLKKKYNKFLSFKITMAGQFFSAVTPLGIGGQPMQVVELTRQNVEAGKAISVLVKKFLIYQSTMAVYSLIVIFSKAHTFMPRVDNFIALALIGFFSQCFSVILLLLFCIDKFFTTKIIEFFVILLSKIKIIKNADKYINKIKNELNFFLENNKAMRRNLKLSIKLYFFTFLQHTFLFLVPFFVYKAFNNTGYPAIDMIAAQSFVHMISSYTPLPGATGTTEGMFLILFSTFFNSEVVAPAMIVCRFIAYYLNIIVGFIVIRTKNFWPIVI
jgi:uncharacterized protein (TIRG00374 family)